MCKAASADPAAPLSVSCASTREERYLERLVIDLGIVPAAACRARARARYERPMAMLWGVLGTTEPFHRELSLCSQRIDQLYWTSISSPAELSQASARKRWLSSRRL